MNIPVNPRTRPALRGLLGLAAFAVLLGFVASPKARADALGDAVDAPGLTWTTGGAAPWFSQAATTLDGVDAAQAGAVTNIYTGSWLETTVTGRVTVVFSWKFTTAIPYYFAFYFGTNGLNNPIAYSSVDWQQRMVSFAGGTNTLRWMSYNQGTNLANGPASAAWLDRVTVTNITGLKPTFLTQPPPIMDVPELYPGATNLSVTVVGDLPMSYQWQRSGTNLSQGYPFNGVNLPTLTLYAQTPADSGAYRLVASNVWGMATSAVCTVSVVPAKPLIPAYLPSDALLAPDSYHELYAYADGTPPFGYQWFKDGAAIPSATNNYHRIYPALLADTGGYSLGVTTLYGAATSRVAQVTVSTALPSIASGPDPEVWELPPGGYAYFTVQAAGPRSFAYSWRRVGDRAELASLDNLQINGVDPTNSGFYQVIVNNNNGAVTSRVSVLAVAPVTALGLALDAPQLTVTNDLPYRLWRADVSGNNAHDGLCAARSPEIGAWYSAPFSTVVTGPTNVSFWWHISAAAEAYLDIAVDGVVSNTISGETPWQKQSLALESGEHTLTWTFRKQNAGIAGADAAWVDQFAFGDGNSSSNSSFLLTNFFTGGFADWYLQDTHTHASSNAWQSGLIYAFQQSWLLARVTGPGTLSFWWRVSSEEYHDSLDFFRDGLWQTGIAGEVGWQQMSLSLGSGEHALFWRYSKDGGTSSGLDAGWVAEVTFTPSLTVLDLGEALDTPELVWATGSSGSVAGNPAAGWFGQTNTTWDGVDAAQSPPLLAFGSSHIETTINGPTVLSVKGFVAGDSDARMEFTMDGVLQPGFYSGEPGPVTWGTGDSLVPPGSHTVRWTLEAGQQAGTNATAWLDSVALRPGDTLLGAALDNTNLAWVGYPWSVDSQGGGVFTGGSAAKSPPTLDNGGAGLYTAIAGPSEIRFAWRVDSAPGDFLQFYLNGQLHSQIDGPNGFPLREVTVNVGPGNHSLMWLYQKNASGSAGADAGWVDNVRITPILKPLITTEPPDVVVTEGQPTGFSVSAVSPEPMTYQWYHGAPLAGRTNDWLPFAPAQVSDAGNYFAVVANSFGSTTSRVALLTVNGLPPVFTNTLLARWVYPRESVHLEVGATSPRPLTYVWQFTTNGFATTNELQRGPDRTYDIASVGYEHSGTWRVVALDVAGNASASTTAKLVVGSRFYRLHALANSIPAGTDAFAKDVDEFGTYFGLPTIPIPTVVGQVGYGGPGTPRAYKFNRYGDTALDGTAYSDFGQANGINADGDVVGRAVGPTGKARAVRWKHIEFFGPRPLESPPLPNAAPEDLGLPPGFADTHFEAVAINDRGQIVVNGNFHTVAAHYALRWQDGNWQSLQDREYGGGGYQGWTVALGISSLGHIAGYSDSIDYNFFAHAWVFDPHNEPENPLDELRVTDLHQRYNFDAGPFGGGYSRATGVNDRGHVVGWRKPTRYTGTARAFLIARGEFIDLNIVSATSGELKINDSGEMIANEFSTVTNGNPRPMVIRDDGLQPALFAGLWPSYSHLRAFVLEDLVLDGIGPFESFFDVCAIRGFGVIAGTGRIPGLGYRPFVLVPASAPGNHPPVARDDTVTRFTDRVMVSASQRLLRNDTDPDPNEVLSLVSYSPRTTNGGTVMLQGDWLTYTPTNGHTGPDQFSYTITDNRGGLASAYVFIQPENPRFLPPANEIKMLSDPPGTIPALRYHGTPGVTYRIQRIDTLWGGTWQTVAVLTAGPDGILDTLDSGAIFHDQRFYRAVQQP